MRSKILEDNHDIHFSMVGFLLNGTILQEANLKSDPYIDFFQKEIADSIENTYKSTQKTGAVVPFWYNNYGSFTPYKTTLYKISLNRNELAKKIEIPLDIINLQGEAEDKLIFYKPEGHGQKWSRKIESGKSYNLVLNNEKLPGVVLITHNNSVYTVGTFEKDFLAFMALTDPTNEILDDIPEVINKSLSHRELIATVASYYHRCLEDFKPQILQSLVLYNNSSNFRSDIYSIEASEYSLIRGSKINIIGWGENYIDEGDILREFFTKGKFLQQNKINIHLQNSIQKIEFSASRSFFNQIKFHYDVVEVQSASSAYACHECSQHDAVASEYEYTVTTTASNEEIKGLNKPLITRDYDKPEECIYDTSIRDTAILLFLHYDRTLTKEQQETLMRALFGHKEYNGLTPEQEKQYRYSKYFDCEGIIHDFLKNKKYHIVTGNILESTPEKQPQEHEIIQKIQDKILGHAVFEDTVLKYELKQKILSLKEEQPEKYEYVLVFSNYMYSLFMGAQIVATNLISGNLGFDKDNPQSRNKFLVETITDSAKEAAKGVLELVPVAGHMLDKAFEIYDAFSEIKEKIEFKSYISAINSILKRKYITKEDMESGILKLALKAVEHAGLEKNKNKIVKKDGFLLKKIKSVAEKILPSHHTIPELVAMQNVLEIVNVLAEHRNKLKASSNNLEDDLFKMTYGKKIEELEARFQQEKQYALNDDLGFENIEHERYEERKSDDMYAEQMSRMSLNTLNDSDANSRKHNHRAVAKNISKLAPESKTCKCDIFAVKEIKFDNPILNNHKLIKQVMTHADSDEMNSILNLTEQFDPEQIEMLLTGIYELWGAMD